MQDVGACVFKMAAPKGVENQDPLDIPDCSTAAAGRCILTRKSCYMVLFKNVQGVTCPCALRISPGPETGRGSDRWSWRRSGQEIRVNNSFHYLNRSSARFCSLDLQKAGLQHLFPVNTRRLFRVRHWTKAAVCKTVNRPKK